LLGRKALIFVKKENIVISVLILKNCRLVFSPKQMGRNVWKTMKKVWKKSIIWKKNLWKSLLSVSRSAR